MQGERPTLYHRLAEAVDPVLLPGSCARVNLQRISEWARAIPSAQFQDLTETVAGAIQHAVDPTPFVNDVRRTMKRDIKIASDIYGLSFVLLGLLVPVEVYQLETGEEGTVIRFLAAGATPNPVRMSVEFKGPAMDQRELDMMHMLTPALAARLVDATRAPRVPIAMLQAARAVPYKNNATTAPIDVVLLRARKALTATGFRAPGMHFIKMMTDCPSLEDWLERTVSSVGDLAALDGQIAQRLESLAACKSKMDEDIAAVRFLCDSYRTQLARCMALGVDALP